MGSLKRKLHLNWSRDFFEQSPSFGLKLYKDHFDDNTTYSGCV
jgi:hypothetical protein